MAATQEKSKEPTQQEAKAPIREADYVILVGGSEKGPFLFETTIHLERSAGQPRPATSRRTAS